MTAQFLHAYKAVTVASLKPWERNPRTHSPAQIEQLRASIREFGFTNPVLIDHNGLVIAGHGRIEAAKLEGLTEIPAIELRGLTTEQKRALMIADNQLALKAEWNVDLLKLELQALTGEGFDLSVLGFEPFELNELLGDPNDPNSEWRGMPEFGQEDKRGFRTLLVHFADAAAVEDFKRLIGQKFTDEARYIWHPKVERDRVGQLAYVSTAAPDVKP